MNYLVLHRIKTGLLIFLGIIILGLGAFTGYYFLINDTQSSNSQNSAPENFGLDVEIEDKNILGKIYFNGVVSENDSQLIYSYDINEDLVTTYTDVPSHSFAGSIEGYDALIAYALETNDPDGYQPAALKDGQLFSVNHENKFNEGSLTFDAQNNYYAYHFQNEVFAEAQNNIQLENWSVAIHENKTGALVTIIEAAAKPIFATRGTDVLLIFMKKSGIYMYNTTTNEQALVSEIYTNLSFLEDFTVNYNNTLLIFTSQQTGLISVQGESLDSDTHNEIGVIVNSGMEYSNPLISPDDNSYAVLASESNANQAIEFRLVQNREVLKTLSLGDYLPGFTSLNLWEF